MCGRSLKCSAIKINLKCEFVQTPTMNVLSVQSCLIILIILLCRSPDLGVVEGIAFSRCYGRLEHALEDVFYKSASRSQFRSLIDLSGYRTEYEFRPERQDRTSAKEKALEWNTETRASEVEDLLQQFKQHTNYGPNKYSNVIQPSRVEVSNIKFRVPRNAKWVNSNQIKCPHLSTGNCHTMSFNVPLRFHCLYSPGESGPL